jgi:hypothetical protein
MSFAEQISHLAQINYAFCSALKDVRLPPTPSTDKAAVIKFLAASLDYRSAAIIATTDEQMNRTHFYSWRPPEWT